MDAARTSLDERFAGPALDPDVWFPYYLPHWSSRAGSAATYTVGDAALRLRIPPDQGLWCPDIHEEPLRVSCVQTGSFAGPLGSPVGQQPFRDGLVVREEQPAMWGYTPHFGTIEVRMRGIVSSRSMVAFWLAGIEDRRERSSEVCVAEIFGDSLAEGNVAVGMGVHRFRDPSLAEEFAAERIALEVAEDHTYGVDWRPGTLASSIDGEVVRRLDQAPNYPMQLMLGVFDFPARATTAGEPPVPELVVTRVSGHPLA